jgi:hypothetical protein
MEEAARRTDEIEGEERPEKEKGELEMAKLKFGERKGGRMKSP